MRIAELIGVRAFRLTEGSIAGPGPGEIQVRVKSVGVCGSDLHNFSEGGIGDTPSQFPMVLGHEPAGEVIKTGPGVSGWAKGDRAVLEPAIFCYHCEFCLSGRHNLCINGRFLSMPADPGFFREYVNLPVTNLLPLPANLSYAEGALAEPLAVALHSLEFAAIKPGDTVVVFGAGPIGLLTLAAVKLAGAGRVWVVEPLPHRRDLALAMGADAVLDANGIDPVAEIWRETGKRGVDVAIDCAAKGSTLNQCLRVSRNGGRVIATAIPSDLTVTLDFHVMRRKETAIFNVRRSNHETDLAIRVLAAEPKRFAPLVTHRMPLESIQTAFETLEAYADGVGKVSIEVSNAS